MFDGTPNAGVGRAPLIVFAGNIAVGKSTAAELVATGMPAHLFTESVSDNPYLERYYADVAVWAFHLNMYFLARRASQVLEAASLGQLAVLDRSFYEDRIFVEQAHAARWTALETVAIFRQLDNVLDQLLPRPAVLVYLHAPVPVLMQRIQQRARPFETNITESFLADLQGRYDAWIDSYSYSPVIRLDTQLHDIQRDPETQSRLVADVGAALRIP
jgi:deoxyadenosine/deoxycytidine kinase